MSNKTKAQPLTEQQKADRERITKIFNEYDADSNGRLSAGEFNQLMAKCGLDRSKVEEMWPLIDKNRDGVIDFKEFLRWMYGETEDSEENVAKATDHSHRLMMDWEQTKEQLILHIAFWLAEGKFHKKMKKILKPGAEIKKEWVDKDQIRDLRLKDVFEYKDNNCNGSLGKSEFVAGVQGMGFFASPEILQEIFTNHDTTSTVKKTIVKVGGGNIKHVKDLTESEKKELGAEEGVSAKQVRHVSEMKDGKLTFKEYSAAFGLAAVIVEKSKEDPKKDYKEFMSDFDPKAFFKEAKEKEAKEKAAREKEEAEEEKKS